MEPAGNRLRCLSAVLRLDLSTAQLGGTCHRAGSLPGPAGHVALAVDAAEYAWQLIVLLCYVSGTVRLVAGNGTDSSLLLVAVVLASALLTRRAALLWCAIDHRDGFRRHIALRPLGLPHRRASGLGGLVVVVVGQRLHGHRPAVLPVATICSQPIRAESGGAVRHGPWDWRRRADGG